MPKSVKDIIKSAIITISLLLFCFIICSLLLTKFDFELGNYKYITFLIYGLVSIILGFIFKDNEKSTILIIPLIVFSIIPAIVFSSVSINILINALISLISYFLIIFIIKSVKQHKKKDINKIRRNYAKKRQK